MLYWIELLTATRKDSDCIGVLVSLSYLTDFVFNFPHFVVRCLIVNLVYKYALTSIMCQPLPCHDVNEQMVHIRALV